MWKSSISTTGNMAQIISNSANNYIKNGDLSASNFTGSILQLAHAIRKTNFLYSGGSVASVIGTAFHSIAEELNKTKCNVVVEQRACRNLGKYSISSTVDLMQFRGTLWTVEDYKTKGCYSTIKFIGDEKNEPDQYKERLQLSINRWCREWMFSKISILGYIHLAVVGDIAHKDKKKLERYQGLLENKYYTFELPLFDYGQTQTIMENMIKQAEEWDMGTSDCESWQCAYCNYNCAIRK